MLIDGALAVPEVGGELAVSAGEEVVLPQVTTSTNQNRTGQQGTGQFPGTGGGNRNGGGFTGTGR